MCDRDFLGVGCCRCAQWLPCPSAVAGAAVQEGCDKVRSVCSCRGPFLAGLEGVLSQRLGRSSLVIHRVSFPSSELQGKCHLS